MTGVANTAVAVLAGLAAGAAFGAGVALQSRQARLAPAAGKGPLQLLAYLARQRRWLAGIALATSAYALQALALAFGPLALVAPVTATDLLFALPLAARWSGRPMRRRDWAGCVLGGGGIAVFLAASPPTAGRASAPAADWVLAFAVVAAVTAGAVTAAARRRGRARAALLALAAGTVFGLAAALTLSLTRLAGSASVGAVMRHWQLWTLAALLITGMLLSASMQQAGPLSASLPVVDTVEPVSSVVIGTLVFGERLARSAAGLALQLGGAGVAVAGIIVLGSYSMDARVPAPPGGHPGPEPEAVTGSAQPPPANTSRSRPGLHAHEDPTAGKGRRDRPCGRRRARG